MTIKKTKSEKMSWYHLTEFTGEEQNFLRNNFRFHPLDLKDCAGEIQRTKIDIYKNYIFIIIQLPVLDIANRKVSVHQVYFFVGKDYLVTIAKEKVRGLNAIYYKTLNNQKFREKLLLHDAGHCLYEILEILLRDSWNIHPVLDGMVREVERAIDENTGKQSVFDIAILRRLILQLKAIIDPQRLVTNSLSKGDVPFFDKDLLVYFDDIDDFIEKNLLILEGYRDRILALQEINESLMSFRTNQTMKVLTSFSVALLPLTLLSGIYGMNIDLPFSNHPFGILMIFGLLALVVIGFFIYLKRKDRI